MVDNMIASVRAADEDRDMRIELTQKRRTCSPSGASTRSSARPLRRTIQREIEDVLAEKMLYGEVGPGQIVLVDVEGEGPTAGFTFPGQKVGELPDLPPFEAAEVGGAGGGRRAGRLRQRFRRPEVRGLSSSRRPAPCRADRRRILPGGPFERNPTRGTKRRRRARRRPEASGLRAARRSPGRRGRPGRPRRKRRQAAQPLRLLGPRRPARCGAPVRRCRAGPRAAGPRHWRSDAGPGLHCRAGRRTAATRRARRAGSAVGIGGAAGSGPCTRAHRESHDRHRPRRGRGLVAGQGADRRTALGPGHRGARQPTPWTAGEVWHVVQDDVPPAEGEAGDRGAV